MSVLACFKERHQGFFANRHVDIEITSHGPNDGALIRWICLEQGHGIRNCLLVTLRLIGQASETPRLNNPPRLVTSLGLCCEMREGVPSPSKAIHAVRISLYERKIHRLRPWNE